jgi:type VI secretion system protein
MYEGSLFEKLTGSLSGIKNNDEDALYRSIANNLTNIFVTNIGSSESAYSYGKPELDNKNLSLNETIANINTTLRELILEYEPRLHDVTIRTIPDAHNVSKINVSISGYMKAHEGEYSTEYFAYIYGDGNIKVKRDN